MSVLINFNPIKDKIIREKHICWHAQESAYDSKYFDLFEVVERHYDHPDAPGFGVVIQIEHLNRRSIRKTDPLAASLVLLIANESVVTQIFEDLI